VANERTSTIRGSLHDVERTLLISLGLVILVVFAFLREWRATLIPSVAVPVSLIGTFGVMYLLGYSLDNLSLMALTVATGFVVDDAIVVLENVMRHMENGMPRMQAALQGAREVAFTVVSMSFSLVAVFIPILLMGGIVGRLFREFAVTLSVAIMVSLVISLSTTPMMCAFMLRHTPEDKQGPLFRASERLFDGMSGLYAESLGLALRHRFTTLAILLATILFNVYLFNHIPKGFFPQQDTGRLVGNIQADQSISFQLMRQKLQKFIDTIAADPNVASVVGFTGGSQTNNGFAYIALKPVTERSLTSDQVIGELRPKLAQVAGASLFLQSVQDVRVGGRGSNAQYQYTLQADDLEELRRWAPKLQAALRTYPDLTDVNSDQQDKGLETDLVIDRDSASRLHLVTSQIDNTLYDAFGQRQVSVIYNALNQYHVVMEVAPQYWQNPMTLNDLWVSTAGGSASGTQTTNAVAGTTILTSVQSATTSTAAAVAADSARNAASNALAASGHSSASAGAAVSTSSETMIPLAAISRFKPGTTPLAVNHQGHFAAITLSFNLTPGKSLSDAVAAIKAAERAIGMPSSIHGGFAGTARTFQDSLKNEPVLILAAVLAIYIVLGILYESYVHPLTILSTLPSAGIGAFLALMACDTEFSLIALIGVFLLIGIVKKNAIMMIDFALEVERSEGLGPEQAIYQACLLRFRPIMMTTMVALLGALPLALGHGNGAELRRPLGISIVGGLLLSQILTLYTTPVVYLTLDRLRRRRLRSLPGTA
jgi:multidrug efflux pump